ncbi:MAG TPA: vitamin K epoxide reductase family protein [Acidimicrobiales bacterium]|nr:vitamin K epoxide reductase family protein [Acidimicrobiales bacterium]
MIDAELRVPRWAEVTTFMLSLLGLGLSIYLTVTHFAKQLLVCSGTGFVDCAKVTTSPQSYFLHVPVAFLGLGTYAVMTAINSPWAWRASSRWLHVARFVLAGVSMGFVLWLVYAEFIIIKSICLYCTAVHVTTFALLIVLTLVSPIQLGWTRPRALAPDVQTH